MPNPCTDKKIHDYPNSIPICRRFREIHGKFKSTLNATEFKKILEKNAGFSFHTVEYFYQCRNCDPIEIILPTVKEIEILKYICEEERLDYNKIVRIDSNDINYTNVQKYIENILVPDEKIDDKSPSDNYSSISEKEDNVVLKKEEIETLKELVNTKKSDFINKIEKLLKNNVLDNYSKELIYKISYYAFERHADKECIELLNSFDGNKLVWFKEYNQLKAKALSKQGNDNEVIKILKDSKIKEIKEHGSASDETINLLAASLKRNAIRGKDELNEESKYQLHEAKEEYGAIYRTQHSYYSAINIAYIEIVLNPNLNNARMKIKEIWENINIEVDDWWSFITDVEIDILLGNYDVAKRKIQNINNVLEFKKISNFNVYSTIRQIEDFYLKFAPTLNSLDIAEINFIVNNLKSLENNGNIANELSNN